VDEATNAKRNQVMKDDFEAERLEKLISAPDDGPENLFTKSGEFLNREGIVGGALETSGMVGTSLDMIVKSNGLSGEINEVLEKNISEGAYWGNITDVIEVYTTAADAYKNRKPADLAQLSLSVGRFATGVIDTCETVGASTIMSESLKEVVGGLLPGVKSGLGAIKNAIDGYQVIQKLKTTNELLAQNGLLNEKDKELINSYKSAIKWKLGEISFDFVLNVAETAAMVNPVVQAGIMVLHGAVNVIKNGVKAYIQYLEKGEKKRVDRIGDIDVESFKNEKIAEKSERSGFREALKSYSKLMKLEEDRKINDKEILTERINLNNLLKNLNDQKIGKDEITPGNLATFLSSEKSTIKQIHAEVIAEKGFFERIYIKHNPPQKEEIIKNLISQGAFPFNDIDSADINTLNPSDEDYFFNKTQIAIKTACNRKHVSTKERLDRLEKLLLSKQNDQKMKTFLLSKYKGKGVYKETPPPGDPEPDKFIKSVKAFKKEIDIS
jgi:hypothetical protein